jgi:hypothetical protein
MTNLSLTNQLTVAELRTGITALEIEMRELRNEIERKEKVQECLLDVLTEVRSKNA